MTAPVPGRPGTDAVPVLSVLAVLLVVVPSRLIFAPLGGAGTPAQVLGIALGLWWCAVWLTDPRADGEGPKPVRRAMLLFAAAVLTSYVVATRRPIDPTELRSADMGLLILCAWLGIVLVTSDCVRSPARLDVLLRRLVVLGGLLAALGLVQFATGQSLLNYFQVPGLTANSASTVITDRSGFNRPAGTALHPIEFGVVLTMLLPLALHYALMDGPGSLGPLGSRERIGRGVRAGAGAVRPWLRRWWPVLTIATALPIAISRSAIVGSAVGLAVLVPTWPVRTRRRAYALLVLFGVLLFVTVPGLIGTLTGLFTGISGDSSAQSRTGSYDLAGQFIAEAPVFGRGFLTFLPSYRILDNQYLGSAIDIGFVGVAALLGVFVTAMRTARRVRRTSTDERTRHLAQAACASIATVAVGFALFDAFSFPMAAAMTFVMVGVCGSLDTLQRAEQRERASSSAIGRHRTAPRPGATGRTRRTRPISTRNRTLN